MASQLWQRIRASRRYARMTQQQLADRLGVTKQSVSSWEAEEPEKRSVPRWENLVAISAATGAPQKWLMSDESDIESFWAKAGAEEDGLDGAGSRDDGTAGMWSAYVVVSRLPSPGGDGVRAGDAGGGLLAYKRSWIDFKQYRPGDLYSYQVTTNAFVSEGISRGDTLLVNVAEAPIEPGWYVVGEAQKLVRVRATLTGDLQVSDGETTSAIPEGLKFVGRVVLQSREL